MKNRFLKAALVGFAVTITSVPVAHAETLRVLRGEASSTLNVAINRAVVVEAETPFAELSIANPGIADISTLSDRTIYVLGRAPGRTTLTLLGPEGNLIANVEVAVAPDVAEFKERLRQILPGEAIEVRTANDGIVLSGTVSSIVALDRALDLANRYAPERVSNLMVVGGVQQVQLKVRFVEMSREVTKQLDGGITAQDGDVTAAGGVAGLLGTNAGNAIPVLGGPALGAGAGTVVGAWEWGGVAFEALLSALENESLARTLAEPNLVALSGQEAGFLAGGEYPVPTVDDEGSIAVEYKPVGVELVFVPRVIDGNLINLQLNAAVSSIDESTTVTQPGGIEVNGFFRREANTTIELRDGESFAIAGLLEDNFTSSKSQTPLFGNIPILGALFRSADYTRGQSELVVIVTPHLVSPTRGEALALPSDRVRLPTDGEFFFMGRMEGRNLPPQSSAREVAKQDFSGSYGYVME